LVDCIEGRIGGIIIRQDSASLYGEREQRQVYKVLNNAGYYDDKWTVLLENLKNAGLLGSTPMG